MSMFGIEPLVPAYGRDYKTVEEFKVALLAGTDFQTAFGQYCSIRDLYKMGIQTIRVRWGRNAMGWGETADIDLPPERKEE